MSVDLGKMQKAVEQTRRVMKSCNTRLATAKRAAQEANCAYNAAMAEFEKAFEAVAQKP